MFMANDLLTEDAMEGEAKRLYRHEVESFIAVLVWITCRYANGKLRPDPPFEVWKSRSFLEVARRREDSYQKIAYGVLKPSDIPGTLWEHIQVTVAELEILLCDVKCRQIDLLLATRPRTRARPLIGSDIAAPSALPLAFYDTLSVLDKILNWRIFYHPSAAPFLTLLDERILKISKPAT